MRSGNRTATVTSNNLEGTTQISILPATDTDLINLATAIGTRIVVGVLIVVEGLGVLQTLAIAQVATPEADPSLVATTDAIIITVRIVTSVLLCFTASVGAYTLASSTCTARIRCIITGSSQWLTRTR